MDSHGGSMTETRVDFVDWLPDELILEILSLLESQDLLRICSVSRSWRRIGEDPILWKGLLLNDLGESLSTSVGCSFETGLNWKKRVQMAQRNFICAITATEIGVFDPRRDTWKAVRHSSAMASDRMMFAATVAQHQTPVLFGGLWHSRAIETAEQFSFETRKWQSLAPMPTPRFLCTAVALGQFVYVIGGVGTMFRKVDGCVERVDMISNTWENRASLLHDRRGHCAVGIGDEEGPGGQVFVLGGCTSDGETLASVERYDVSTDQWEFVEPMPEPRHLASAACVISPRSRWPLRYVRDSRKRRKPIIYVFCGFHRKGVYDDVQRFDVNRGEWKKVCVLAVPRIASTAVAYKQYVYIFGGTRPGTQHISRVERYDTVSNTVTEMSRCHIPLRYHGAQVIVDFKCLINKEDEQPNDEDEEEDWMMPNAEDNVMHF